jgi:hypothetical protein
MMKQLIFFSRVIALLVLALFFANCKNSSIYYPKTFKGKECKRNCSIDYQSCSLSSEACSSAHTACIPSCREVDKVFIEDATCNNNCDTKHKACIGQPTYNYKTCYYNRNSCLDSCYEKGKTIKAPYTSNSPNYWK